MSSNELLSGSTEQPSTPEKQSFDYDALDSETRIVVQQRTNEIKSLIRQTAQGIIDIGQKLTEVKQQLGHGNFMNWLKSEFNWSISTATRFMQVSEQFKFVNLVNLEIATSALYLLAAPSTPVLARQEGLERATQREAISHTKAKAIVTRHKEAAKSKAPKPVSDDVSAETVERESSISDELEATSHTKPSELPLDMPAFRVEPESSVEIGSDDPASVDQFEQELMGKGVATEILPMLEVQLPATQIGNRNERESSDLPLTDNQLAPLISSESDKYRTLRQIFDAEQHRIEDRANQRTEQLNLQRLDAQVLLHVKRNHSKPADVDDCPKGGSPLQVDNNTKDICTTLLAGLRHLTYEQVVAVLRAFAYYIGPEAFSNLVLKSINQEEVVNLCNKCLASMNERAFLDLEVEKINFSTLSGSALKFLIKESKRSLNERQTDLKYFKSKETTNFDD